MVEQMKPSGIDYIGDIPQSWLIGRVKNFYKILTGFTPDTSNPEYYDDDLGYDWITIADIDNAKYITETKSKISQKYLQEKHPIITPKGSLLYSFKLSVGKVAFAGKDIYTNEAIASFVEDKNVSLKFLYYSSALIIENANINIYGAKIMNQELIGNAPIVFPTLEEQRFIADFLDKQCGKIDEIISDLEKQIETLQKYKKSLILETVTKGLNKNVPMKSSGIDWIGDIPAHWDIKRLKYLLEQSDENMKVGPFGSALSGGDIVNEGKWVYNQRVVLDDNFNETDSFITEEKFQEMKGFVVKGGDLLITTRGTIGKVAIVPDNPQEGILHPCIIKFRVNKELILPELVKLIFNESDIVKDQFVLMSNATTIEVIYSYSLKEIILPVIPMEEQKAVFEFLNKQCSIIDSILKDKQEQLEKIKQHKKSLIYEYVTGKKRVKEATNGN